jgi:hypothetical protein
MSIMAWLLAIIARESSDGISPTVKTDCALAGWPNEIKGRAMPADKICRRDESFMMTSA